MKLWKCDTQTWTVREVNGQRHPGSDDEGSICYENTHFQSRAEAVDSLKRNAEAFVKMSADALLRARKRLLETQEQCGEAAIALSKAIAAEEGGETP